MSATNGYADLRRTFGLDGMDARTFRELATNAFTTAFRREMDRRFADPRRNLDHECGYPDTSTLTAELYQDLYDRDAIAARVVEIEPRESWQVQPRVYEDEDADTVTDFEAAWDALGKSLRGEQCWYRDEEGSPVWEYLRRADELCGIGSYGIVLLGLDDGRPLREPIKGIEEVNSTPSDSSAAYNGAPYRLTINKQATANRKLLFLRCLPEVLAEVNRREANPTSPRFGQPLAYQVTLDDPRLSLSAVSGRDFTSGTQEVHWSRVVHVADNRSTSEWSGVPRMRSVLNNLLNLQKLYGAGAEGYYKSCFAALQFATHPEMGGDADVDPEEIKDAYERFINGLQRVLVGVGGSWSSLAPSVVDPTSQVSVQIDAICISKGYPKRIFVGSERGELASSQDERAWLRRMGTRQQYHLTPRVIVPFVDRMIAVGVLPPTKEGYTVWWPDLSSQTDAEKANLAAVTFTALGTYASQGVEAIVPPLDALTRVLGWDEEEAQATLDAAAAAAEEKQKQQAAQQPPPAPPGQQPPPGQPGSPPAPPEAGANPFEQIANEDAQVGAAMNAFCGTGPGGGVDPSCAPGGGAAAPSGAPGMQFSRLSHRLDEIGQAAGNAAGNLLAKVRRGEMDGNDAASKLGEHVERVREAATHAFDSRRQDLYRHLGEKYPHVKEAQWKAFQREADGIIGEGRANLDTKLANLKDTGGWALSGYRGASAGERVSMRHALGKEQDGIKDVVAETTDRLKGAVSDFVHAASKRPAGNVFCGTGPGGGIDSSCSPGATTGHEPGEKGHTAGVWGKIKAIGAAAIHAEHVVKAYVADKVQNAVARLPLRAADAVDAAFAVTRAGAAVAFASWTAGQKLAERVAVERGATPEQARRLRGVLASVDLALAKPIFGAGELAHVAAPVLSAASMIPPATAGYLAYSTARNPLATGRAASDLVDEALGKLTEAPRRDPTQARRLGVEGLRRNRRVVPRQEEGKES